MGWPRVWLVGDAARLPDATLVARALPRGAGVLARDQGAGVLPRLARLCRRRGLGLLVSGDGRAALAHRAGLHVPDRRPTTGVLPYLIAWRAGAPWARLTVAVHGRAGLRRLRRLGAAAAFVSPAFATASHPGAPGLGPHRWARLAAALPPGVRAVALGGVSEVTARRLPPRAVALAAIGAFAL